MDLMIKNKKGSHVGVIISFALFIMFLVFLFIILKPSLTVDEKKETTLNNLESLFINYLNSELTTASVKINSGTNISGNCVGFSSFDLIIPSELTNNNIFVKNSSNGNMDFEWKADNFNLLAENNGENRFFKIYASGGINSQNTTLNGCKAISETDYTLGIVKTEEQIFEKSIINAMTLYKANYTALKQNIGFASEEFGFDFTYENGTTLSTGESSENKNVYAKEIPVNYLDNSLNNNAGSITIKTW